MFEIGNSLREARTRRRIEFAQAEQATKVRGKYLRALEDEQFELLPSPTYVKGFLRTYADYLGLDGQLYVDEYNSRFVIGDAHERSRSVGRDRRSRRLETAIVGAAVAAIGLVTVVVISAWTSSGSHVVTRQTPRLVKQKAAPVAPPALSVAAVRGSSFLAVHRGSASGPVLFEGTVARGQTEPFAGTHFWVNVSSPENLVIRVRGKKISLVGYRPRVVTVTPTSWHLG
ncbi:MAG: helix-turn-helix domain-containing protein [Actinobacteria bacterium]|nr:helix-turn-helix domain-containing protein [Actinomycetota bacterium]MBV8394803.1 helix-turn-helix domain-containing protein [Actinomycetota bacterium]